MICPAIPGGNLRHGRKSEGGGGGGNKIWKVGTIFIVIFCFACFLAREVGDVRRYPNPVSGKLTKMF